MVDRHWSRHGVGRALVEHLVSHLQESCFERLLADVPEDQLSLQLFAQRLGFWANKIVRKEGQVFYRFERRLTPVQPKIQVVKQDAEWDTSSVQEREWDGD